MGIVNTEAPQMMCYFRSASAASAWPAAAGHALGHGSGRSPERGGRRPRKGLPRGAFIVALCLAAAPAYPQTPFRSLKEIRERGVIMQQWETSCAAAAVATVLTYGFNDPVSERHAASRMLERTDPAKVKRRGGFSLLDLQRFVAGRGYQGNAYQHLGFDDLRVFHAPIVPINQHGYNHYVVFNGVMDDQVLLADPAFGNRRLSIPEFISLWMQGMAFVVTRPPSP